MVYFHVNIWLLHLAFEVDELLHFWRRFNRPHPWFYSSKLISHFNLLSFKNFIFLFLIFIAFLASENLNKHPYFNLFNCNTTLWFKELTSFVSKSVSHKNIFPSFSPQLTKYLSLSKFKKNQFTSEINWANSCYMCVVLLSPLLLLRKREFKHFQPCITVPQHHHIFLPRRTTHNLRVQSLLTISPLRHPIERARKRWE